MYTVLNGAAGNTITSPLRLTEDTEHSRGLEFRKEQGLMFQSFEYLVCNIFKGPLILLCQIISAEYPTNFEFGATFFIVVCALNWSWFVFDLVFYIHQ